MVTTILIYSLIICFAKLFLTHHSVIYLDAKFLKTKYVAKQNN